jgi:hypothetical protein
MAIGDGIRRDVQTISPEERTRLLNALLQLDTAKIYPDGVTYWDKQEDIHKNAHFAGVDVHGGPGFLPWHRELVNRLEALLREVDPDLSLHYWDWTKDPRDTTGGRANLFTTAFMGDDGSSALNRIGGSGGDAGAPFQDYESTEGGGHTHIWRDLQQPPPVAPPVLSDHDVLHSTDGLPNNQQYAAFRQALEPNAHDPAHGYIGGTIGQEHFSFHDPFVFLLHSDTDRLFAMWQTDPANVWRLDPTQVYGLDGASLIGVVIQPWAGDVGTGYPPLRPWAPPDNQQFIKTYDDITIVAPPCYDTLPTTVQVIDAENPGGVIRFNDVPVGETTVRAAVFKIFACVDVTLQVSAGPAAPYSILIPPGTVTVHHGAHVYQEARIWFAFTGGVAGTTAPSGNVTIHCVETGQNFNFTLEANTIARPTVGIMLILDQSGSMAWPAGYTGNTRIQVLHDAASQFVQLVEANNGVGMVRFDNNAYPGVPVQTFGASPFDPNRAATLSAVQAIAPNGATSIGNGITLARSTLDPVAGYEQKAMIIFTDGLENTSLFIADVMNLITNRTFAIGLGTTEQVSTGALTALTNNTGGYMLLSGLLAASTDDYFRLSKYFLQVLAGVTNNNVVLDPTGDLTPGTKVRIPFYVSDTDIDVTIVLLTDYAGIPFDLETPHHDIVTPATAIASGAQFASGTKMSYYRFTLPLVVGGKAAQAGTWYVILQWEPAANIRGVAAADKRRIRYSLNVHSFSNLRMEARLSQNSLQPGAVMTVRTLLSEYGVPVSHRATVMAKVEAPDGSSTTLAMPEGSPGAFEGSLTVTQTGVYRFRVVASGSTWRGLPFTREQSVTGTAFPHGDSPYPTSGPDPSKGAKDFCDLLECVVKALGPLLEQNRINPAVILECIKTYCAKRAAPPTPAELALREGTSQPVVATAGASPALVSAIVEAIRRAGMH